MKRENRYLVLTMDDIHEYLTDEGREQLGELCSYIEAMRRQHDKPIRQYVCVADHWPEYEIVWSMIAARVDGTPAQNGGSES